MCTNSTVLFLPCADLSFSVSMCLAVRIEAKAVAATSVMLRSLVSCFLDLY
jgi:hypothetical protein